MRGLIASSNCRSFISNLVQRSPSSSGLASSPERHLIAPPSPSVASTMLVPDNNVYDLIDDIALPMARVSRLEAEAMLRNETGANWLLRPSSVAGCVSLSVLSAALTAPDSNPNALNTSTNSVNVTRGVTRVVRHVLVGRLRTGGWCELAKKVPVEPTRPTLRLLLRAIGSRLGLQMAPLELPTLRYAASRRLSDVDWSRLTPLARRADAAALSMRFDAGDDVDVVG